MGHRAWDPGALPLARALAARTGAPLFTGTVSRLVVDLNRRESDPDVVPARSFGLEVPGNQGLDPAERERRLATWHRPFREAVRGAVEQAMHDHGAVLQLSVHSFTPVLDGVIRGVEVGVLHDPARDPEHQRAARLRDALMAQGLDARLDEPYLGTDEGFTTWFRERLPAHRYAGIELELSQGLPEGATEAVLDGVIAGL